jgi:tetratricopeptide (TPR) repeat protein
MKRKLVEIAIAVAAIVMLFEASRGVEGLSQRKRCLEVLYLPSGRFIEQAALGYHDLAADLLWFRMVQYYGGYRMGENDLALFKHLFEVGIAFLENGIRNNPNDWWLPFELGFLEYVYARDYDRAVANFERAAKLPGAGPQAERFAAFAAARAGHIETSIAMWEELARTSDNRYIRELAGRYIEKLRAGAFSGTVEK